MVGGDVVMLVVFIPFWFRLVNKVGVITGQGQKKNTEVKLIWKGGPDVMDSYNILKWSCKAGVMNFFVPNWILLPHLFIVGSTVIVFTATCFPRQS